jgi:hypothetical protein
VRTFSISCRSGESLKVSLRCNCNPKACQIRLIAIRLSPVPWLTACAPVGLAAWGAIQSLNHGLFDLLMFDLARRSWSRFIIQPLQTSPQKARPPLAHHAKRAANYFATGVSGSRPKPPERAEPAGRPRCATDSRRPCSSSVKLKGLRWASGSHLSLPS